MKNIYIIVFALFALSLSVKAQDKKLREIIYGVIIPEDKAYIKSLQHKNEFVTFSFAIGINTKGMIDSIKFSDTLNDSVRKFIDFKKIDQHLKKNNKSFMNYKNSLVFGMILIANGDEAYLNPNRGLYSSWPNLLSNLSPMLTNRKLVVLDPVVHLLHYRKSD